MKQNQSLLHNRYQKYILLTMLLLITMKAFPSSDTTATGHAAVYYNPLFMILAALIVLLAIVIVTYTEVIKAAVHLRMEKDKKENANAGAVKTLILISVYAASQQAYATAGTSPAREMYYGMDALTFYLMVGALAFEAMVIGILYIISISVLREKKAIAAAVATKKATLMEKLNASVALEHEADIMLDHNYDGIQELDNDLPPWWKYGFYLTIAVGIIYMAHYHITGTGKLQLAEYNQQLADASRDMEAYRKKAANQVDENNVGVLTDVAALASGKLIYSSNCAACHGAAGEGGVGPNLTDAYWLHKGSIKDIFRSVKYGWPEKGMKSWQQDLGPKQIHEVSSFIKSLKGTMPANPKARQGELFVEEGERADSAIHGDSTLVAVQK